MLSSLEVVFYNRKDEPDIWTSPMFCSKESIITISNMSPDARGRFVFINVVSRMVAASETLLFTSLLFAKVGEILTSI